MSRPLTAEITAHYAKSSTTLATLLRLDLRDGTKLGFTDHDLDLPFDLGDGEVTFVADEGIFPSDVELRAGLEAGTFEVRGPIATMVTREHLIGGRFNRALAWLFEVNWQSLGDGYSPIAAGFVSNAGLEGGQFVFEILTQEARFEQVVGQVMTVQCRTYYGSPLCTKVPETLDGTVATSTDEMLFTVDYDGSFTDGYFDFGTVEVLDGPLAGTDPVDIHKWTEAGAVELFTALVEQLSVGTAVRIKRGCPRSLEACTERDNAVNFRGEPHLSGSDRILRPTIPGEAENDA